MGFNFSTGNFVADAAIHTNLKHPDSKAWANCSIALISSGGIKASIKPGIRQRRDRHLHTFVKTHNVINVAKCNTYA